MRDSFMRESLGISLRSGAGRSASLIALCAPPATPHVSRGTCCTAKSEHTRCTTGPDRCATGPSRCATWPDKRQAQHCLTVAQRGLTVASGRGLRQEPRWPRGLAAGRQSHHYPSTLACPQRSRVLRAHMRVRAAAWRRGRCVTVYGVRHRTQGATASCRAGLEIVWWRRPCEPALPC
eukprot:366196-Chlamydomonas_euryale.AAC.9